jgi:predicted small secreted protein
MKKIITLILIALLSTLLFTGCESTENKGQKVSSYGVLPNFTILDNDINEGFAYAIDNRTDLVYIIYCQENCTYPVSSMCPSYNSDGTIMTRAQLNQLSNLGDKFK